MEIFRLLSQFADDTAFILFWFALVLLVTIIAYWFYNRRKFHSLRHQIPASVVKNYLDSIIQNSTALKSSLFRGGGLDVGQGIPSVVPLSDLPMGHNVSGSGISQEELNQKNAQISMLNGQLVEKRQTISDLEAKVRDLLSRSTSGDSGEGTKILQSEIASLQKKIHGLESELTAAKASGAGAVGNPDVERQLTEVTKERDELKERLMEYEIIEEDLANLKRLQQENEQLKKSLAAQGGAPVAAAPVAAAPAPKPAAAPAPAPKPEPAEPEEDLEAAMAAAIADSKPEPKPAPVAAAKPAPAKEEAEIPANEGEQKSAEELLSEFEKMLG